MARRNRIVARPSPQAGPAPTGPQPLAPDMLRDGYVYVPHTYRHTCPSAVAVILHGSGGHAHHGMDTLQNLAEEFGLILVAPVSTDYTWDVVFSRFGPDVIAVNRALEQVFSRYAVDAERIAISGFSDGASYALALGLANGDLFTHLIAFSPGFVVLGEEVGRPRVFVSHGTRDEVLPASVCSERILARLERRAYELEYVEFEGGHRIPPEVARRAFEWLTESAESAPGRHRPRCEESRPSREG
jgi:phospholipase/carboxylesterase